MTLHEIEKGIQNLCTLSKDIAEQYKNDPQLIDKLSSVYKKEEIKTFIELFANHIITQLGFSSAHKKTYFDTPFPKTQDVEPLWLAIFTQESTKRSLLITFETGCIGYGIYNFEKQRYVNKPTTYTPETFSFEAMLDFFRDSVSANNLLKETEVPFTITSKFAKNIILYGPPGTGKTYHSIEKAVEIATNKRYNHEKSKEIFDVLKQEGQIEFVTFHPNYAYEDFMVGLRPDVTQNTLQFKPYKGIFYQLAQRATENYLAANTEPLKNYVLIIDEINRANISKVFGELITLLEEDKRLGAANQLNLTLPNGERAFGLPPNLYLIGTMNTADKSISMIDIALRRRFEFIGYLPNYSLLNPTEATFLRDVNKKIYARKKSTDYFIGHAYFMTHASPETTIQYKIIPLLLEYFSEKVDLVTEILHNSIWDIFYDEETFEWMIKPIK